MNEMCCAGTRLLPPPSHSTSMQCRVTAALSVTACSQPGANKKSSEQGASNRAVLFAGNEPRGDVSSLKHSSTWIFYGVKLHITISNSQNRESILVPCTLWHGHHCLYSYNRSKDKNLHRWVCLLSQTEPQDSYGTENSTPTALTAPSPFLG